MSCLPTFHRVRWCGCVGSSMRQELPSGWLWSSCRVFPAFCPLSRFMLVALLVNVALFRVLRAFLAWFGVVVWVCVGSVICVACGAFVRVWS